MYALILRYPDPAATAADKDEHIEWVRQGSEQGKILLSGPFAQRNGGVIIIDLPTRAEFDAFLATEPYGRTGVATHDVMEFEPRFGALLKT